MPNSLIILLNWVTNDKAFNADDNPPEMQIDGLKKCLELIDFGNTVKELAISWFFGFHPSLKCSWLIL
jgi:hypothetical protein